MYRDKPFAIIVIIIYHVIPVKLYFDYALNNGIKAVQMKFLNFSFERKFYVQE